MHLRGFRKAARDGNGGKRSTSWILGGLVAVTMAISLLSISSNIVLNLQCHVVSSSACHHSSPDIGGAARNRIAAAELEQAASFAAPLQHALALELGALFLVSVLLSLGSKELAQPDWDLEWLVTMPVEPLQLLWGRVLERSAANLIGIFLLGAAYGMIAWYGGKGWPACHWPCWRQSPCCRYRPSCRRWPTRAAHGFARFAAAQSAGADLPAGLTADVSGHRRQHAGSEQLHHGLGAPVRRG
jgi:hypothetical protein